LSGCSALEQEYAAYQDKKLDNTPRESYQPASQEGKLHQYIENLARQLFDTANILDANQPIIVGTFLPANSLSSEQDASLKSFGLQLQESFTTLSTQAGLKVIEYKSLPGVVITEDADLMLSRDLTKLNKHVAAQYLLTGNYLQQENSLIVNVKLISVNDKSLVAAATDYLPLNSLFGHDKVRLKDGMLYRGEY
jgi:TolB-like protein